MPSFSTLSLQLPIISAWILGAVFRIDGTTCAATESTTQNTNLPLGVAQGISGIFAELLQYGDGCRVADLAQCDDCVMADAEAVAV